MKTLTFKNNWRLLGLFTILSLVSCSKDDGPEIQPLPDTMETPGPTSEETPTVFGIWEAKSGSIGGGDTKYVFINEDNTIDILDEDELGFRSDFNTNITVSENQITLSGGGEGGTPIYNYSLEGDELTIILPYEADPVKFERASSAPDADTWVKPLSMLNEGVVPWERDVDIAFDGTYLLGFYSEDREILKIDPTDFSIADRMPTTRSAYSVEIEKSDSEFKQLFQSSNGSNKFYSYIYSSNTHYYDSEELGSWIRGLASVNPGNLWVSSSNAEALYHYKSNGALSPGEVLKTVGLDFQPGGLDYQDGYLYLTERNRIHKCITSPEFRAVASYKLSGQSVNGIAFDGSHFWLSTKDWAEGTSKVVQVVFPD
ncbi:hypothetical protein FK220_019005 [Flavobacteriaceae bacterium TP-CH-4]|uniref:Uncharacterized protein n=1 Tax=Pelagihabitans pacificus TaxID=2696054 RepID=A0A967AYI2_9FLAO|nr:hypothetical protein [Pelagihabitans pacificus]NHF61450.1 hypothetical protein [Pelagihabitans pacificus]